MTLTEKRDEAVAYLRNLQEQARRAHVEIERVIGRITTLNELLEESKAPTEGQEGDGPGTRH